jgi:hypothetical protein
MSVAEFSPVSLVTSGLGLLALVVLAALAAYRSRLRRDERLLGSATGQERIELASAVLGRFNVPLEGLTREQRFNLALEQIRGHQRTTARVIGIAALLLIACAVVATISIVYRRGSESSTTAERPPAAPRIPLTRSYVAWHVKGGLRRRNWSQRRCDRWLVAEFDQPTVDATQRSHLRFVGARSGDGAMGFLFLLRE